MFLTLLTQFISIYIKNKSEAFLLSLFFMISVLVYSLLSQHQAAMPEAFAIIVIWMNALIAQLLSNASLYQRDYESGMVEQWCCLPLALEWVVVAKIIANWVMSLAALIVMVVVAGLLFNLSSETVVNLLWVLPVVLLGQMALASIGSALMARQAAQAVVVLLIMLPFSIPLIVFGASITLYPENAFAAWPVLIGINCVLVPLSVWISAYALRQSN